MGKTPEKLRLVIWVDEDYVDHPQIAALREKGHEIVCPYGLAPEAGWPKPHLILSRTAHLWTPKMFEVKGLLEVALRAARGRKKGDKE